MRSGKLGRLLTPGWLALHVIAVGTFVALVGLGRWQWQRAVELDRIQNYSYALEWWLFAGFAVFLWVKTMADTVEDREEEPEQDALPAPAPLPVAADEDEDPELAAWNAHLRALHARDQAER